MELGIGLSFGLGAGAATGTVTASSLSFGFGAGAAAGTATASAAAATATGVTAVAFAPAAAVAAVGMLAFSVWKLPDLLSQLSPQACRPDDVSSGRRAQLRVSKQHLKNRSKPKGSLPTLLATRHVRRVAATSANLPKVPEADAGMAVADDSSSPLRSLDVIRSLGAGQFGQVLRVKDRSTASEHALKIIQVRPDMTQQCHMEKTAMAILSQKGAPYILELVEAWEEPAASEVYLLLELCPRSVLGPVPMSELKLLGRDLMTGLCYMHELGILHRDIKPDNLLLNVAGELRIADFGWCCLSGECTRIAGTPGYMAPEVLMELFQGASMDGHGLLVADARQLLHLACGNFTGNASFCFFWGGGVNISLSATDIIVTRMCLPRRDRLWARMSAFYGSR